MNYLTPNQKKTFVNINTKTIAHQWNKIKEKEMMEIWD